MLATCTLRSGNTFGNVISAAAGVVGLVPSLPVAFGRLVVLTPSLFPVTNPIHQYPQTQLPLETSSICPVPSPEDMPASSGKQMRVYQIIQHGFWTFIAIY